MIFINTRPTNRARNLTVFLQKNNTQVLNLPLLELVACKLTQQAQQYLTQANDYHVLIFISETAVSYFFDFIKTHQLVLSPNINYIAVGQKTAQALSIFWQQFYPKPPNLITPNQFNLPENNEGLLQLPMIQNLKKGERILIIKGKDGRNLLKNCLIEKDVKVDEVNFYQRIFPLDTITIFQEFFLNYASTEKIIVLITSLTAWQHWQKLLFMFPEYPLNLHYLVLQSRIAETVAQSNADFTVLSSLEPHEILEKLKFLA